MRERTGESGRVEISVEEVTHNGKKRQTKHRILRGGLPSAWREGDHLLPGYRPFESSAEVKTAVRQCIERQNKMDAIKRLETINHNVAKLPKSLQALITREIRVKMAASGDILGTLRREIPQGTPAADNLFEAAAEIVAKVIAVKTVSAREEKAAKLARVKVAVANYNREDETSRAEYRAAVEDALKH